MGSMASWIRHLRTLCEYYDVSADYVLSLKRK
jgi:hypothetical protein